MPEAASGEVRELLEPPYRIIYRATDAALEVIAIVHSRQELARHLQG
ncbi:MAG TPA: hypothetical protein VHB25_10730 [Gemmatimonadaceae bacterium]|nr:hypothetical protein [Gemmatimonadaceae bacterium]